jgi:phthiocerol/phenolphthiocerol synthesis type-I polyketide synthase E
MSAEASNPLAEGIAIIGMAGRFPGAPDLEAFWQNLKNGVESVTHFSDEELETSVALRDDPRYVRARAVLPDVDLFDADFFGLQPREAEYTDPQHRLLLETAWEALESAGCDSERFTGSIGVFAGCSLNSYLLHNLASRPEFLAEFLAAQQMGAHPAMLGNDKDFLATRISYKLNLRGPSMAVQSACSTSLVAVCVACQNLLTYQCDLALAGGVSVTFPQRRGYLYEEGGIVSRDGRCRPFDAAADGTVFGDGVGLVVLKRAEEARRDGDFIHAIIRGFATNNDGSAKVSYMAPGVDGQVEAITAAHALAGVEAETIGYVEAHGTGTALGDPIEVAALTKAFRAGTQARQFCALGALKGNIGHLEVAAGVAGLIKAALVVREGEIPPTLNFEQPNPRIDFAASPFYVSSKLQPWPKSNRPRRAGVSSFGVGGTNAHLVLEQAPASEPTPLFAVPQLIVLSAKTASALPTAALRLARRLRQIPEKDFADAAFTLQTGRRAFRHRIAFTAANCAEAAEKLESLKPAMQAEAGSGGVAFLFPGQGAQHAGMGRELYAGEKVFREQVDLCCELLAPDLGLDLRTILYPAQADDEDGRLAKTSLTQPALFVVEYALAQTWLARGVRPRVLFGHSLGEYVAAVLAGVFTLPDALHLLAVRGRLMESLPPGEMLAVALSGEELAPLLGHGLEIAAVNGPRNSIASGPSSAMAELRRNLAARAVACRDLKSGHAFHSAMMDPILAEFEREVRAVPRNAPKIPLLSSRYGREATAAEWTDPAYWSAQLRHTVRFAEALAPLLSMDGLTLLEVGPGQTLTALARQHPARRPNQAIIPTAPRTSEESDELALLTATGGLWLAGVDIAWTAMHPGTGRRRIPLPTYPFERKRFWIEPKPLNFSPDDSENEPVSSRIKSGRPESSTAPRGPASPSEIEAVIAEQLRLMARQIEILREAPVANGQEAS